MSAQLRFKGLITIRRRWQLRTRSARVPVGRRFNPGSSLCGFKNSDLKKLDVLINNQKVDALSIMVHSTFVMTRAREITQNLQKLIPRQMFDVPIQVALGSKIISRETVKAYRKNVTAKLYGGDVTRKKKLLEKQKEGKKKMKQLGKVSIPQEAFLNYFNTGE